MILSGRFIALSTVFIIGSEKIIQRMVTVAAHQSFVITQAGMGMFLHVDIGADHHRLGLRFLQFFHKIGICRHNHHIAKQPPMVPAFSPLGVFALAA